MVIRLQNCTGGKQASPHPTAVLRLISWGLLEPDQPVSIFGNTIIAGYVIIITLSYQHLLQSEMLNCSIEVSVIALSTAKHAVHAYLIRL